MFIMCGLTGNLLCVRLDHCGMLTLGRLEKLRKFLKAITRPTRSDLAPIRVKEVHRCEELESVFDR